MGVEDVIGSCFFVFFWGGRGRGGVGGDAGVGVSLGWNHRGPCYQYLCWY